MKLSEVNGRRERTGWSGGWWVGVGLLYLMSVLRVQSVGRWEMGRENRIL